MTIEPQVFLFFYGCTVYTQTFVFVFDIDMHVIHFGNVWVLNYISLVIQVFVLSSTHTHKLFQFIFQVLFTETKFSLKYLSCKLHIGSQQNVLTVTSVTLSMGKVIYI